MRTTKAITYAFPTSPAAKQLGFYKTGCFYVQQTHHDIEGSGQARTFIPHDAQGFATSTDPDLLALFAEYDGDICPHFRKYGDSAALRALGLA